MKWTCTLLTVLCLCLPPSAQALNDKQVHALTSAGLSVAGYAALRQMDYSAGESAAISAICVLMVAAGKEYVIDDKPDFGDMTANAIGIYTGLMIPLVFRW